MKPDLYIFCGIPGCGKTTLARMLAKRIGNAIHIQTDTVRHMIAFRTYTHSESLFVYNACIILAGEALRNGYNVILDGTFTRQEYREKAIQELRGLYEKFKLIHIKCDIIVASMRNKRRKMKVPSRKLISMYRNFEQPINAIVIDTTELEPEVALSILINELNMV